MIYKHDLFGKNFNIEKMLDDMDRKNTYVYISTEYEKPSHHLFKSVEPIEDCWICKTKGQAPLWLQDLYQLVEHSVY